jgi:hypothetical protein
VRLFNRFRKPATSPVGSNTAGAQGWGAPLQIKYAKRALPPVDNAASYAYQTYLSPVWTPIGTGIPNQRDIGTAPPAYAVQGALLTQVGSPGILAGGFYSGPLTNVSTASSEAAIPMATFGSSFELPGGQA